MQCSPTPYSSPAQWGTAAQHCCCGKSTFLCTRHPRLTCRFTCSHIHWASAPMFVKLCHTKPSPKAHGVPNAHLHTHPSVLALGHVSKPSLKPRTPEGFSTTVTISTLKRVSKDMRAKAYREDSAQNQVMGFRSRKKFLMGRRVRSDKRKWGAAPVEQPEGQRNPDTQISKITCPKCLTILITQLLTPRSARNLLPGWKALGKQPQTQEG